MGRKDSPQSLLSRTSRLICAGTTEGGLAGYEWNVFAVASGSEDDDEGFVEEGVDLSKTFDIEVSMSPLFSYHPHTDGIKATCITGNMLLTGGTNEIIKTYNIKKGIEMQPRFSHESTITVIKSIRDPSLPADSDTYIMSADAQGTMFLWNGFSLLEPLYTFKMPNQNPCIDLSIHPSAKLALTISSGISIGFKRTPAVLSLWDMEKGINSGMTNLDREPKQVAFSPNGDVFIVLYQRKLSIHATTDQDIGCEKVFEEEGRTYSCAAWLNDDILAVGDNQGSMYIFSCTIKEKKGSTKISLKETKTVRIPSDLPSKDEPLRIKYIKRMDSHDSGVMHVCAITSQGRYLLFAADRTDLLSVSKSEAVMDEFVQVTYENVRVSSVAVGYVNHD